MLVQHYVCAHVLRCLRVTLLRRRLQLNADKTEVIWFGSRANLNKLHSQEHHIQLSSEIIIPTSVVRDLGVQLDSELSMKQHIRKVAATCFSISVVCDRFVVVSDKN